MKSDVKRFVDKVKACHFFSFDSESKGTLKRPDGTCSRLFSSMSCPKTGTTFLFYDALDIPKEIVKCLEDYAITKIQSGIANDVELFKDCANINMRGVVDSGTLFLMIKPKSDVTKQRLSFSMSILTILAIKSTRGGLCRKS